MLAKFPLVAAVFIGGMEGVEAELAIFQKTHPNSPVVPVASPGGAARDIAARIAGGNLVDLEDVDFARLFHRALSFGLPEARPAADPSGGA